MSLQASMRKIRENLHAKAKAAKDEYAEERTLAELAGLALAASTESPFEDRPSACLAGLALAEPHGVEISLRTVDDWRHAVETIPAPCTRDGERLLKASVAFLEGVHAKEAVSLEWDEVSLFGIHKGIAPRERPDAWGLVPALAWSPFTLSVKEISAGHAVLISENAQGGSLLTMQRHRAGLANAVAWWRHPALVGEAS
jgi:hypothetical protein